MSDVKNALIKIAYENPELRAQLLPIIMKAGAEHEAGWKSWFVAAAATLGLTGVGVKINTFLNNAKIRGNINQLYKANVIGADAKKAVQNLHEVQGLRLANKGMSPEALAADLKEENDGQDIEWTDTAGAWAAAQGISLSTLVDRSSNNKVIPGVIAVNVNGKHVGNLFLQETQVGQKVHRPGYEPIAGHLDL